MLQRLKTTSDPSSHTPDRRVPVYYFCVEAVAVYKRHKLQKWCRETYGAELEVFDGLALAEALRDADIFWIADEYLDIPADVYPARSGDRWYMEYRERWLSDGQTPYNHSDFLEIKYGLRAATFQDDCRPDLGRWLTVMGRFLDGPARDLARKARYEIAVAGLRGQKNLTPYRNLVTEFLSDVQDDEEPWYLLDAAVLLSYSSTAVLVGEFEIERSYLGERSAALTQHLEKLLARPEMSAGRRCQLVEIRAFAAKLPFRDGADLGLQVDELFFWRGELLKAVPEAPLFPLDHFANVLSVVAPWVGEDPRFLDTTQRVDELLAERSGHFAAAEKCRDRALAMMDSGNMLLAIEHLHLAKIKWFAAETVRGTILSAIVIGNCYGRLGLTYAAKYYFFTAAFLAFHASSEKVRRLVSKALFCFAEITYYAGEWLTFFPAMEVALWVHHNFDRSPLDIGNHESLQTSLAYASIVRTLAARFEPALSATIEKLVEKWPLDDELRTGLQTLT